MSMEINESPKITETPQQDDNKPKATTKSGQIDESVWTYEQPAMQNIVTLMNAGCGKEVQEFSDEMRNCCDEYRDFKASHGDKDIENDSGLLEKLHSLADKTVNGLKQLIAKEVEVLKAHNLKEFSGEENKTE